MRQGTEIDSHMGHFLNSICDMGIKKQQRHATLPFLKIDRGHGDPPTSPIESPGSVKSLWLGWGVDFDVSPKGSLITYNKHTDTMCVYTGELSGVIH